MDKRENLLRALRRDYPEYVPFDFTLCPSQTDAFERVYGTRDYMGYCNFPFRYVEIGATKLNIDYKRYYQNAREDYEPLCWLSDWGIMGKSGRTAHFQEMLHPMQGFTSADEILAYPWPDFIADYRWAGVKEKNNRIIRSGYATVAAMQMTIFELAWYHRGLEEFLIGFYEEPEFNEVLLDEITKIRVKMARKYAEADSDILMLGDDVSTQLDMMISPDLWRQFLKPRLSAVITAAKEVKPDIIIFYHGDGNLSAIIPDLIEIGVDVLNPVQPECMDPYKLKEVYGDKLSFWGGLGTQTTLPFGDLAEVDDTCRTLIEKVGKGGGYVLGPTHIIEPEVPFENIEAFLRAARLYGKY